MSKKWVLRFFLNKLRDLDCLVIIDDIMLDRSLGMNRSHGLGNDPPFEQSQGFFFSGANPQTHKPHTYFIRLIVVLVAGEGIMNMNRKPRRDSI